MAEMVSKISTRSTDIQEAFDAGAGILRLTPAWVPRTFSTPGRRLRLHPDDYFAFGPKRGGICERWLASAIRADNGEATGPYEGMSLVVGENGNHLPFDDVVRELGERLIGERIWAQHGAWPIMSKFFDNQQALPFHIHHDDVKAARVNKRGKSEAYYFSPQMNPNLGMHPYTYLGLKPGVSKGELEEAVRRFGQGGDNEITTLSTGFRIRVGTGWDVPAGLLHAPGSACTYEPQVASDVLSMFESWSNNRELTEDLLWKDQPVEGDYEDLLGIVDWAANVDPDLAKKRFMKPFMTKRTEFDESDSGWNEKWIVYKSDRFSAKELVVAPGRTVEIKDQDAYGCIVVQGYGLIGGYDAVTASTIRFGQDTEDEFFVSAESAKNGIRIENRSKNSELVILKHFGPGNEELGNEDI